MPIIMGTASRSSNDHRPHVTVAFIISLIIFLLLPLTSAGEKGNEYESLFKKKMVLGSKPPACVNKCSSCRPCVATLVVPSHKNLLKASSNSHGDDDSYYLLSWKCRCGNKLFQP
ncbi:EPIDERMAL PATTERNING FACTOR-like protein 8 [Citrus sinensis]|uniref:EPIDERMAL PATTERNING FACTOR-like protein 8 n=1 Tax=Citrus sinensis TaxID=2711 RepID=A0ACB8JBZ2_CITSI|nr:EPIDERMAL PATTERNING FACTOR-like protein 8 [Citrus sinensis]